MAARSGKPHVLKNGRPRRAAPTVVTMGAVPKSDANVEFLLRDLPDQNSARLFLDRLAKEQPRAYQNLLKQPALLADVLALAAWSPLLATKIGRASCRERV